MQIMFVIGIFILNGLIITNINLNHEHKVNSDVLNRQMYEKIEMSAAIAPLVKIAYDLGQQSVGCPGTSREVNLAPGAFKLCWVGIDANNCFDTNNTGGFNLCISTDQSLAYQPKLNFINLVLSEAYASGGGPKFPPNGPPGGGGNPGPNPGETNLEFGFNETVDLNYTGRRVYSKGDFVAKTNPSPVVAAGFSQSTAGARVILPPTSPSVGPASRPIRDYVNCQTSHTECFNVSFCMNGSSTCNGKDKVTQTFAVRHF